MKRTQESMSILPILVALVASAGLSAQDAAAAADVTITEVAHVVVGGVGSTYVEVANLGDTSINVAGWRLCSRIDYDTTSAPGSWGTRIAAAHGMLQPGDVIVIEITSTDSGNIEAEVGSSDFTNVTWSGFNNSVAEDHYDAADVALYAISPFGSAANMRDLIKWNSASTVGRESLAVANGFWPAITANIPSPLSTDITDSTQSQSIQLEMKETSPGSGVFVHESPDDYFVVNNTRHSLGRLSKKGDADGSGTIDNDDTTIMINECLGGPDAGALPSECSPTDFDSDGDVDLRDAAEFQLAFEG
ncbi:MAG: hypothetical protein DHS20C16_08640 [Phycisphaerae bacterium]|nr:MAG: hypothetical protein DHS20C16_08640 [Phycisphaerae bacterium]